MFKKLKQLFKQLGCIHTDTRYKLPLAGCKNKGKYVEICSKCGSKKYIK